MICAKKSKFDNCSKNDDFSKKTDINLLGHLQCISNSSKVIKPFNLSCSYSFSCIIVRWHYYYSQLYNTFVNCFQKYFKPKVSAPISDNEKFNSFNFKQGTPCRSNNVNNVYGSKDHVHIKTNTLVDLNSIYYERSILVTTHQVIYIIRVDAWYNVNNFKENWDYI